MTLNAIRLKRRDMNSPDINAIRNYVAYGSVGASTVRGLKTKGVAAAARKALQRVDLKPYGRSKNSRFHLLLDRDTERVRLALPRGARHWGVARKVLNIFLRGALYNTYLNLEFKLSVNEANFEIPLDSVSASGIRNARTQRPRPRWDGVKHVTPESNRIFQDSAKEIAEERGTSRVHLDAEFWGGR